MIMIKILRKLKKTYIYPKEDQVCFSSCFLMLSLVFLIFKTSNFPLKMLHFFSLRSIGVSPKSISLMDVSFFLQKALKTLHSLLCVCESPKLWCATPLWHDPLSPSLQWQSTSPKYLSLWPWVVAYLSQNLSMVVIFSLS